jgi:phenylpyruvate tautomerase PptA (4-oxalocrotonate tautomerase family)
MVVAARVGDVSTAEPENQKERIAAEVSTLPERHMVKPPVS